MVEAIPGLAATLYFCRLLLKQQRHHMDAENVSEVLGYVFVFAFPIFTHGEMGSTCSAIVLILQILKTQNEFALYN